MERKKYIDAVKGFNILMVMFSHAGGIPIIGIIFTACFMQVFFAVAGYTYCDRPDESGGAFIKKKAKRLLIPYFVYGFTLLAVDAAVEKLSPQEILFGGVECYMPDVACSCSTVRQIAYIC